MKRKKLYASLVIIFLVFIITTSVKATMSLEQLQSTYSNGFRWTDTYYGSSYDNNVENRIQAQECAGFSALMYYNYYGIDPFSSAEIAYDVEQAKPGDIVRYNNDEHSVWILSRNGESVQVAECNYDGNCSVRWYQTKSMSELRTGFSYIYKAPYVLGGTEPELTAPNGVNANLSGTTLSVSWNRPIMASGYIIKIFTAESIENNNFSSPVITQDIKFPNITSANINFNKTGDYYVYVYTKRGDRVSESGGGKIKISSYPITAVEISSNETGNLVVGNTRKFIAKVLPENTTIDKSITWGVIDSSIATVTQDGVVTALKQGGTYLYAKSSNGKYDTYYISVKYTEVPITGLGLSGLGLVNEGSTTQLTATIYPDNATGDRNIKWSSNDESIAKVDSNGVVTGIKEGETSIKAETINGLSMTWEIKVKPGIRVTDLILNKTSLELTKGNTEKLSATINPYNATNKTVTWLSSDSSIATVDNNGNVIAISKGTAVITAKAGDISKTCNITVLSDDNNPTVKYRTHVQSEGWQDFVENGETSGTSGKSLRLEGIKIELDSNINGGIKYSTHVQKEGWQAFVENGALSGTTGKSLRLEAIKIELTGKIVSEYDVYYRVHAQKFGWMGWAKNGEQAGTQGYGYRLEGIQIKLIKKGENGPTSTALAFSICPTLKYSSYVQSEGWNAEVTNGQISGTTGNGLRMEAFNINLRTYGITGGVKYAAHVQKQGWQDYVSNGKTAGTTGKDLRMEAIRIELTEEMAKTFDIYYRVHTEKFGWLGWAKNGEVAGTQGYGYRVEAIQIQLLPKGSGVSGSTENAFVKK